MICPLPDDATSTSAGFFQEPVNRTFFNPTGCGKLSPWSPRSRWRTPKSDPVIAEDTTAAFAGALHVAIRLTANLDENSYAAPALSSRAPNSTKRKTTRVRNPQAPIRTRFGW